MSRSNVVGGVVFSCCVVVAGLYFFALLIDRVIRREIVFLPDRKETLRRLGTLKLDVDNYVKDVLFDEIANGAGQAFSTGDVDKLILDSIGMASNMEGFDEEVEAYLKSTETRFKIIEALVSDEAFLNKVSIF